MLKLQLELKLGTIGYPTYSIDLAVDDHFHRNLDKLLIENICNCADVVDFIAKDELKIVSGRNFNFPSIHFIFNNLLFENLCIFEPQIPGIGG